MSTNAFTNFYFWVSIHESETNIRIQWKKDRSSTIRRREFPLILGWACSVHKGQGLTLQEVVTSFDLLKQKRFNDGHMYVALSRVTLLNGLYLTGKFKDSAIRTDSGAAQECHRLLALNQLTSFDVPGVSSGSFTFTISDVHSLNKYATDIKHDNRLLNTDVLCLTETQLVPSQSTEKIEEDLP